VSRAEIAALLEAQRASLIEQNMPPERIRVIEVMIAAFSRSRDTGPNLSESEIESVLCVAGSRPEAALQQICRTSILRDELISELSLDLTDSERAELVHAAIGDPSDADYGARAAYADKMAAIATTPEGSVTLPGILSSCTCSPKYACGREGLK